MIFIILDLVLFYYIVGEDSLLLVVSPLLRIAISHAFLFLFVWLGGAHLVDELTTLYHLRLDQKSYPNDNQQSRLYQHSCLS
jgi:hypothetical protein